MARAIDPTQAKPYILESDRELPEQEQTIFYIKPKDGAAANRSSKRYLETLIEKNRGKRTIDVKASNLADVKEFLDVVERVESYAFSDKFYEENPNIKERTEEVKCLDGEIVPFVPVIEEDHELAEVCRTLSNSHLRELFDASDDVSKLRESIKKD